MYGSNCVLCNSPHAKACKGCQAIHYCSRICQETDWPLHKLLCKKYQDFKASKPAVHYVIGILFPPDEKSPRLIWVKLQTINEEPEGTWQSPQIDSFLGNDEAMPERIDFDQNVKRRFATKSSLIIYCRESFLHDGSKLNQSVVATTRGSMHHCWKGPFVVLRDVSVPPKEIYRDVTLTDLRHVVDYFSTYGDDRVRDPSSARPPDDPSSYNPNEPYIVQGVKIACEADRLVFGTKLFSKAQIPRDHHIVLAGSHRPRIAQLCGIPLRVEKLKPDPAWKNDPDPRITVSALDNLTVTFLFTDAEPSSDWWGWAPSYWRDEVGSVIVIREDCRPLSVQHIEALCEYVRKELRPWFEDSLGAGLVQRTKHEVIGKMTKAAFQDYWVRSGRSATEASV